MKWNVIDEKLIEAYTVLVLADHLGGRTIPEKYQEEVDIRVAEKTIAILEDGK